MEIDINSSPWRVAAALCLGLTLNSAASADEIGGSFFDGFDTLDTNRWVLSDGWTNGEHQGCTWSADEMSVEGGILNMRMSKGEGGFPNRCSEIQSLGRYGYGTYETRMKGMSGSGLVSAFFTYIGPPLGVDDHDEIDFELLGQNSKEMQLNFYTSGEGENEAYVDIGLDGGNDYATYAFQWTPDRIVWYVNGRKIHESETGAALPSNPGKIFFSLWNGTEVVDDWLGPFEFPDVRPLMLVDWVAYTAPGDACQFPESIVCTK